MKLIILAGGSGTRLWPLSRKNTPKQTSPIIGEKTLLQKTYERLRTGFEPQDIYIATNCEQAQLVKEQLSEMPKQNYFIEPARRDTAAAIGLAMIHIHHQNPNEIMMNINSDHFVKNEAEYIKIIKLTEKIIKDNPKAGVLVGVNPTYPETGYGYIKMAEQGKEYEGIKVFEIAEFKEKPSLEVAKEYFEKWEYLWNIGCFAFRVDALLDLYKQFLPDMYQHLIRIEASLGTKQAETVITTEFTSMQAISMDYGIIEKSPNLYVIPADFGWADVGHWRTVKDILSEDIKENIKKGNVVEVDSFGNLVYAYSDKLIALVGVDDMVVVETPDAILVCSKEKAQDVKKLVDKLKEEGLEQYL